MASSSGGLHGFPPWLASRKTDDDSIYLTVSSPEGSLSDKNIFLVDKSIRACATVQEVRKNFIAGTYTVKVASLRQAEQLKKLTQLADQTPVKVVDDTVRNKSRAVITCRDLKGILETEIAKEMKDQGVIMARHFKRKVGKERVATGSVLLTFNKSTPPEKVKVGCHEQVPTRQYYPPPTICYGCFAYGHVATKCEQPKCCFNCFQSFHGEDIPCPNPTKCKHCSKDHPSASRLCEVWKKEERIVRLKIDQNISAAAARKLIESENGQDSAKYNNVVVAGLTSEVMKKEEELKKKEENIQKREVELERKMKFLEEKGRIVNTSENDKYREIEERLKKMEEMVQSCMKTIEDQARKIESKNAYIRTLEKKVSTQQNILMSLGFVDKAHNNDTIGQDLKRSRTGRNKSAISSDEHVHSESELSDTGCPTSKTLLLEITPSPPSPMSESERFYLDEETLESGGYEGSFSPAHS